MPAPVLGRGGYPGGLLEEVYAVSYAAGVAVDLGDALQGPHGVAGLAASSRLGEELFVEGGHRLVVALDAAGLGHARERVAADDDVPAAPPSSAASRSSRQASGNAPR